MNKYKSTASEKAQTAYNTTEEEIARFSALADKWWDPEGPFKPLHHINPIRLSYIRKKLCEYYKLNKSEIAPLREIKILDIGCGGGLISEPLARMGATVTAIDAAEKNIFAAHEHAKISGLNINYRHEPAESLAFNKESFDVVIALEVVEHVEDLFAFVNTCSQLTKPGGCIFFSTLNRTVASWALGIVVAEYLFRWLPRGTHDWKKFVRPSELITQMKKVHLSPIDIRGMSYDPISREWNESKSLAVNYLLFGSNSKNTDS